MSVGIIRIDARVDIILEEGTLWEVSWVDFVMGMLLLRIHLDLWYDMLDWELTVVHTLMNLDGVVNDATVHRDLFSPQQLFQVRDGLVGHTDGGLNLLGYGDPALDKLEGVYLRPQSVDLFWGEGDR